MLSWRVVIGLALSTGGLAVVAGTVLVMHPTMPPLAQMGIAAVLFTEGFKVWLKAIPEPILALFGVVMTGYTMGRSWEKVKGWK